MAWLRRVLPGVVVLALAGCASAPTGDALFEEAHETYLVMHEATASVQLHIHDDLWRVQHYGDIPRGCGENGYEFYISRMTTEEWLPRANPREDIAALAEWMADQGWHDVETSEIRNVHIVEASLPEASIAELRVSEGPFNVVVSARSTCEHGSSAELAEMLLPGRTLAEDDLPRPTEERPGERPIFGFTRDGEPRR